jgi:hypothetical protein
MKRQRQKNGWTGSIAAWAGMVLSLAVFNPAGPLLGADAAEAPPLSPEAQIAALKTEKNNAVFQVQHIVNQPVTRLKRTPNMVVSTYSPGWFHPGAGKPDFNTVDVRKTQELSYADNQYVTSDLNPGVVFLGHELEFNRMTKYFITDRSVPKKKLTEAEMLEINRLYRIIGHCNQQLDELLKPRTIVLGLDFTRIHDAIANALDTPVGVSIADFVLKYRYIWVGFVIVLLVVLQRMRKTRQVA